MSEIRKPTVEEVKRSKASLMLTNKETCLEATRLILGRQVGSDEGIAIIASVTKIPVDVRLGLLILIQGAEEISREFEDLHNIG